jgi:hypothetical protein
MTAVAGVTCSNADRSLVVDLLTAIPLVSVAPSMNDLALGAQLARRLADAALGTQDRRNLSLLRPTAGALLCAWKEPADVAVLL